jgi:DNA-dependent RNA polymerase auxiliary subunit epsilon
LALNQKLVNVRTSKLKRLILDDNSWLVTTTIKWLFVNVDSTVTLREYLKGKDPLTTAYLDNLNDKSLNKYKKILWICYFTYRLLVIKISYN